MSRSQYNLVNNHLMPPSKPRHKLLHLETRGLGDLMVAFLSFLSKGSSCPKPPCIRETQILKAPKHCSGSLARHSTRIARTAVITVREPRRSYSHLARPRPRSKAITSPAPRAYVPSLDLRTVPLVSARIRFKVSRNLDAPASCRGGGLHP